MNVAEIMAELMLTNSSFLEPEGKKEGTAMDQIIKVNEFHGEYFIIIERFFNIF